MSANRTGSGRRAPLRYDASRPHPRRHGGNRFSRCSCCTRRRARGTSTAMCCRCSAAISARSRWTRSASGILDSPAGEPSIELWAEGAFALLDALEEPRAAIVGHHTGAAIAVEMAASRPARVARWCPRPVLSSMRRAGQTPRHARHRRCGSAYRRRSSRRALGAPVQPFLSR